MAKTSREARYYTIGEIDSAIAELKRKMKDLIMIDEVENRLDRVEIIFPWIPRMIYKISSARLAEFRKILVENKRDAKRR